jgi:hydrogenase/urease accessory protein HupE
MTDSGKALVFWALLAIPQLGLAHSPIEGIDSFYSGLLHPVFVPAHLLLVIALGLFIGQRRVKDNQSAVLAFLVAVAAGLIAAWFSVGTNIEVFILSAAAFIGILIVASFAVNPYLCALIAALAGFLLGADSAQETLSGQDKFVTLFGSGLGLYLLLLYPMAAADVFHKKSWQRIGVRVVGSWIAASSLLVLALSYSSSSMA